jgi:hypothetical protein
MGHYEIEDNEAGWILLHGLDRIRAVGSVEHIVSERTDNPRDHPAHERGIVNHQYVAAVCWLHGP